MRRVWVTVASILLLLSSRPALAQDPTPAFSSYQIMLPSGGVAVVEATITYGEIFVGAGLLLVAATVLWGHVKDVAQMMTKK